MATEYSKVWKKYGCIVRQRGASFQVEKHHDGKRSRQSFPSLEEATAYAESVSEGIRLEGSAALAIKGRQRAEAIQLLDVFPTITEQEDVFAAKKTLAEMGATVGLLDVVKFWISHHPQTAACPTLSDALADYLKHKGQRRASTLHQINYEITRFIIHAGEASTLPEVTTTMIEAYLASFERVWTQKKMLGLLTTFLDYCRKVYKVPSNPAKAVLLQIDAEDEKEVEAYSVEEARNIMFYAAAHPLASKVLPVIALGFFAGLRPSEVQGLDWADVSLAARRIRVSPETAKRRRSRFVDMSDNLIEWLTPYAQTSGAVAPAAMTYRRARETFMEQARCKFIVDGFRHTFGTYHLAAFEKPHKTALLMGHRANQDLIFTNYRKLVTREEAMEFWRIIPAKQITASFHKEQEAAK